MAVITATEGAEGRVPYGASHFIRRFTFTVANTAAADEWINTGFETVIGVLGGVNVRGVTKGSTNYVLNAKGTGQAVDSTLGVLGVESDVAAVHEVVVIGE